MSEGASKNWERENVSENVGKSLGERKMSEFCLC